MLERTKGADVTIAEAPLLARRRVLFFTLVTISTVALVWLSVLTLSAGGFGFLDLVLVLLFGVTLPWTVIGFWNAMIGLYVIRTTRDPAAVVLPAAARVLGDEPIVASTALLMCIRNEPPERVTRYLAPLLDGLAASGAGARFQVYVLSDTHGADPSAVEEAHFADFAHIWQDRVAFTYRRRVENAAFKAGNIADFCERWGRLHEFAVVLDADSIMTAAAVLRLVRIMQADAKIGILQSLVVGLPSLSAFARLFQFGMRLSMRSYTIGSAWWQGDCGPYWGHNAILRLAPFMAHCELPPLPEGALVGGHVLSHDQVEAVLMRRAGYEVRVLAEEGASFEQNPPTLIEFVRRDMRWCQGNMQYWHFLGLPGIRPISRYQLMFAILMFLGSPAWIGLLVVGTAAAAWAGSPASLVRPDAGIILLVVFLIMWFAPNLATALDVLLTRDLRRAFGGPLRFVVSVIVQITFVVLLLPIMWFGHTVFLARLLSGRTIGWGVQARDDHEVPLAIALRQFWPQTLLGIAAVAVLGAAMPAAIPCALFVAGGLVLSVPLAVITTSPAVGQTLARIGLCQLPEETAPPTELRGIGLPAVERALAPTASRLIMRDVWRTFRGVIRSLRIYYGDAERCAAMDRLYGQFIRPGDLVFDIGAHVGDRVGAFRRLGAKVVAVEPQPALVKALRLLYGRDQAVVIEPAAVGQSEGTIDLRLNIDNPTVSTASDAFVRAADGAPGWEGQSWTRTLRVPVTTLDAMIARHGGPAFIKIDVEGFEAEVLAGIARPVPALSFEFTTIQRDVAAACIKRCAALGYLLFNAALGESQAFAHPDWQSGEEIARWIATLPAEANSGDIYAKIN